MSRNLAIPYFPNAPREYNQQYISEIVRAFSVYVQQVQNPGEGRNTFGVFTNLQTDDSGLETGAIFNHGGWVNYLISQFFLVKTHENMCSKFN